MGLSVALELSEPIRILLIIGANIFGAYALYKLLQMGYWFIKDSTRKEEY